MSISPGKWGELLKSFMIKEKLNIAISKTAPIILVERIVEFLALLFMVSIGVLTYQYGFEYLIVPVLIMVVIISLFSNELYLSKLILIITKITFLKKYQNELINFTANTKILLKPIPFSFTLILSILSWIFESFGFYLILLTFTDNVSIMWVAFVYSFAIVVGAISMLPGGIGATEGSLVYLLINNSIADNHAIAATLIIRLATLWFSIFLGSISLFVFLGWKNKFNLGSKV